MKSSKQIFEESVARADAVLNAGGNPNHDPSSGRFSSGGGSSSKVTEKDIILRDDRGSGKVAQYVTYRKSYDDGTIASGYSNRFKQDSLYGNGELITKETKVEFTNPMTIIKVGITSKQESYIGSKPPGFKPTPLKKDGLRIYGKLTNSQASTLDGDSKVAYNSMLDKANGMLPVVGKIASSM